MNAGSKDYVFNDPEIKKLRELRAALMYAWALLTDHEELIKKNVESPELVENGIAAVGDVLFGCISKKDNL